MKNKCTKKESRTERIKEETMRSEKDSIPERWTEGEMTGTQIPVLTLERCSKRRVLKKNSKKW